MANIPSLINVCIAYKTTIIYPAASTIVPCNLRNTYSIIFIYRLLGSNIYIYRYTCNSLYLFVCVCRLLIVVCTRLITSSSKFHLCYDSSSCNLIYNPCMKHVPWNNLVYVHPTLSIQNRSYPAIIPSNYS